MPCAPTGGHKVGAIIDRPPMDLQLYGGAIIASLFEGGVEQTEAEGVMRLRRMRNAETAFPTLPAGGFLLDLRAISNRPYLTAANR